ELGLELELGEAPPEVGLDDRQRVHPAALGADDQLAFLEVEVSEPDVPDPGATQPVPEHEEAENPVSDVLLPAEDLLDGVLGERLPFDVAGLRDGERTGRVARQAAFADRPVEEVVPDRADFLLRSG